MRFLSSAALALVAMALLVGFIGGDRAEAAQIMIRGTATGAEENPPVLNGGSAQVTFVFNDVTNDLSYNVTVSGLSADQVTASHIHRGARGVNGPIIHNLSLTGFTQISGVLHFAASDVADLRAGNYYFNVHSKDNPSGFARLQLVLPAAPAPSAPIVPLPATLPTSPVVTPPSTGDAGLADRNTAMFGLAGLLALTLSGAGVFALARRNS